ncbi:exonuclease 3'-5' domain-containing protein 2 [Odontomachus brunneus]|uniref:exonuclease 3'-5' domain-containing protein 2 n=1 Tax=Odontomachus brunneus TaxID=486640 RepID=UPI0013F1B76F|nr:exonuclease 3'-5' domain-containing protein 2 [Odontomachus brunneus]
MLPARNNMFLVCVTVGLVFLASKYRNNVLRSVKHLCKNIASRDNRRNNKNIDDTVTATNDNNNNDNNNNCKDINNDENCKNDNGIYTNINNNDEEKRLQITLDKIILADSLEKCDYAVQRIRCNLSEGVLGFDCEWVNEGPVCLLQLATFNGVCALFRIGKIGYIPDKLKELLSNKHILKVGVASFEDGQKILKDHGCQVSGTLDIRGLAEAIQLPSLKSLAAMSLEYLSLEMDKIIELRCGDWEASTLTDEQVKYAACDAIISILIYQKIMQIMQKTKQRLTLWQRFKIYLCNKFNSNVNTRIHGVPAGIVDTRFKARRSSSTNVNTSNSTKILDRSSSAERKNTIPTRNKPLYHNCYLQAPDGEILCTCDRKKAEWYIGKGLGELVHTDPYTVKLNFEPSGRALGEVGQYYTQVKVNQCVVCGCTEKFIRKNVVPREYRKYFPLVMKAHQSHDVLLLCPSCHENSNNNDLHLRRKLAELCDAPLIGPLSHMRDKYMSNFRKLQSAVKVLKQGLSVPQRRREELEFYILEYTGQKEVTPVMLDTLHERLNNVPIQQMISNQFKYLPHGLKVVQYFQKQEGGLVELERMWREHFLTTMNPKYLPNLWSVRHNQERLIMRQAQNRIEPQDAKIAGLIAV